MISCSIKRAFNLRILVSLYFLFIQSLGKCFHKFHRLEWWNSQCRFHVKIWVHFLKFQIYRFCDIIFSVSCFNKTDINIMTKENPAKLLNIWCTPWKDPGVQKQPSQLLWTVFRWTARASAAWECYGRTMPQRVSAEMFQFSIPQRVHDAPLA